ncbi:MAG: SDR family NAD(P)-dependent oxidoreductase [Myxococcales bacterium]|nr:SDR family NAD(P)-dependent oxidoreductase [Myxococcales bacterium]
MSDSSPPIDFRGKRVVVTGGAGTVGFELVQQLLARHEPEVIRLFDHNEANLHAAERSLRRHTSKLRFLLGDVRDSARVTRAFEDVDVVLHTAAVKHVPLCEYNPFEAVLTNLVGMQNVIDAALTCGVERVIFTSTDKAVGPVSVMGASKLMAEKLLQAAHLSRGKHRTVFASTRFGNVLDSRGSVVQVFRDQIVRGGPVTVTHIDMTRYLMSLVDAGNLVLRGAQHANGGELFVLKMPVVRIDDLARVMIAELAPRFGHDPASIAIHYTEPRAGEKLYEELLSAHEMTFADEVDDFWVLQPAGQRSGVTPATASRVHETGRSDWAPALDLESVALLLHRAGVL